MVLQLFVGEIGRLWIRLDEDIVVWLAWQELQQDEIGKQLVLPNYQNDVRLIGGQPDPQLEPIVHCVIPMWNVTKDAETAIPAGRCVTAWVP